MAPVAASTTAPCTSSSTMASSCASSSAMVDILVINPNSSSVITEALCTSLSPQTPPGCTSSFLTGPATSPESIQDVPGSIISAAETYKLLSSLSPSSSLSLHPSSAFLVACFSDHPLVGMLRQKAPHKPAIHLLEAAIIHALSCGTRFGVLTTGRSVVPDVEAGVRKVLGGNSDRYVGTHATGLGVVELQTGNRDKVIDKIKKGTTELLEKGADVVILGCAGMTGMEDSVRNAAREMMGDEFAQNGLAVIDGAKAGLQILAGLARVNYRA